MADNNFGAPPTLIADFTSFSWKSWFNNMYERVLANLYLSHITTSTATTADKEAVIIVTSNVTITLPTASENENKSYYIKRVTAAGAVTVSAADNIDGAGTASLAADYDAIHVFCDGSTWHIIGRE